jgi:hypothetical protein
MWLWKPGLVVYCRERRPEGIAGVRYKGPMEINVINLNQANKLNYITLIN